MPHEAKEWKGRRSTAICGGLDTDSLHRHRAGRLGD
jgi:hypothetical protein